MIDSHLHLGLNGITAETLIEYLDTYHLDKCWLLTWEEVGNHIKWNYHPFPVEPVLEAYQKYPDRIVPFYAPDPNRPDAVERFQEYYHKGIRGCGELKANVRWDSPQLQPLLECIHQLKLPLIFHMEEGHQGFSFQAEHRFDQVLAKCFRTHKLGGIPAKTARWLCNGIPVLRKKYKELQYHFSGYLMDFETLERALQQYPDIKFIGHGPFFWKNISKDVPKDVQYPTGHIDQEGIICYLLTTYDNLYADLSGGSGYYALTRDPTFARTFLIRYATKLLYGTDNYQLGLKSFLDSLDLPANVYDRIYHQNAKQLIHP
ncbi:MAG: hypothetical protein D6675_05450 [Gemmatimonadetes bacterium]|nr:MAG: hypothetical protein D6675_05450 [Gemmatimonadota bacterium]